MCVAVWSRQDCVFCAQRTHRVDAFLPLQMLEINEDMLAVAAECHADDDAEGSIA